MPAVSRSASASLLAPLIAGLGLLAASQIATAQTTVRMTTPQQTDCVAVTDGQGLRLVPGGTDLQASGVTLTGDGCGAEPANFQATVSVPSTATTGTPFNVTWSASQDATACTYGGTPTAGVSGWAYGSPACSGEACVSSHTVPVTVATAGSYNFSVTCTNASGYAASQNVSVTGAPPPPPTPDNFALTVPASAQVGVAFPVSWTVHDATSCAGTADLNGSSVSLPGWTDSTSTANRSVTASVAGTYTLRLSCTNATTVTIHSQPATVTVNGGTNPACTVPGLTQLRNSGITYPNQANPSSVRPNVDLTQFVNLFGYASISDAPPPIAWPGIDGAQPAIMSFGKTQFIAAKFTVPANVAPNMVGNFGYGSYFSGPAVTLAISATCGDFNPPSACVKTKTGGESFSKWAINPPNSGYCQLNPGTDYYINIKLADPTYSGVGCSSSICQIALNSGHNP